MDDTQCAAGAIQRCTNNGTAWTTTLTCATTSYCNDLVKPVVCAADTCAASSNACNGEKLATCAADGGHFTATGADCAASNTVCSLTGACVAEAADTVAITSTIASVASYLNGNVYRVDRARKLTKIEHYLLVSGTSAFTWVVYESTSATGTFTKVFEKTTSDTAPNGAFVSSGAISVPLTAGKFYMIGVLGQNVILYFDGKAGTPFVSFGQLTSGLVLNATSTPATVSIGTDSTRLYQRLSTSL